MPPSRPPDQSPQASCKAEPYCRAEVPRLSNTKKKRYKTNRSKQILNSQPDSALYAFIRPPRRALRHVAPDRSVLGLSPGFSGWSGCKSRVEVSKALGLHSVASLSFTPSARIQLLNGFLGCGVRSLGLRRIPSAHPRALLAF